MDIQNYIYTIKHTIMDIALQNTIVTELHNMIDHSCTMQGADATHYESLHRAIIKKYFEAESVTLDRENNSILLEVFTDKNAKETTCTDVDVDFNKFNEFLKSCIDENHSAMRFYQNMLRYYHVVEPISA